MTRPEKLLKQAISGSKNVRFDEFVALIEAFGFVLKRISGSHHIYKHPLVAELLSLQPDKNGKAKPYQIRQFLKILEEYDLKLGSQSTNGDGK